MTGDAERGFLDFVAGRTEPPDAVRARLGHLGIDGPIGQIRYGLMRKIMVWLPERREIVKIALHPAGAALLRREAQAYDLSPPDHYQRPALHWRHDQGEWMAIGLGDVSRARPIASLNGLIRHPGPYENTGRTMTSLSEHLDGLGDAPCLARRRDSIIRRFPAAQIATAPSHGDFVHWNLLTVAGENPLLLDYEYYASARSLYFDRCLWLLAPLLRHLHGSVMVGATARMARILALWLGIPVLDLLVSAIEYTARLEQEQIDLDILALHGPDNLRRRQAQLAAYGAILDQWLT